MPWRFELEGVRRAISAEEHALIARLLSTSVPGASELRWQLDDPRLRVTSIGEILSISFLAPPKCTAVTNYRVPVEARSRDVDGMEICVLLHVVDGYMSELEIYRADGEEIERMPTPESLEGFFIPGEPF